MSDLDRRAAVHAALGDPGRLAVVDQLSCSDRSPGELARRLGMASNLLAHHLDVLEAAGVITRSPSAGDGRRRYVRLERAALAALRPAASAPRGDVLFLCTRNSARSQLAAALWVARTGRTARSAGTDPAPEVHRRAVAAARRAGLTLDPAGPQPLPARIARGTQVITVCDLVHEELEPGPDWWHWSVPDPVAAGTDRAFDDVVAELDARITGLLHDTREDDR